MSGAEKNIRAFLYEEGAMRLNPLEDDKMSIADHLRMSLNAPFDCGYAVRFTQSPLFFLPLWCTFSLKHFIALQCSVPWIQAARTAPAIRTWTTSSSTPAPP